MLTASANLSGVAITVKEVYVGETKLTKTTHYTVSGGKVTIKKEKLADLLEGNHVVTIETAAHGNGTAILTVTDTTTLTTDSATAVFDKNTSGDGYDDVAIEVKHNTTGVTLTSVHNGEATLTAVTHYTTDGLVVTILKTYLVTLDEGDATITFKTNKGDVDAVITIEDTTDLG